MSRRDLEFLARVEEREIVLEKLAKKNGMIVTMDGRVSEANAAQLIGFAHSSLQTMRNTFGTGPRCYRIPAEHGHKYSYYLRDLAHFIESKAEGGNEP